LGLVGTIDERYIQINSHSPDEAAILSAAASI